MSRIPCTECWQTADKSFLAKRPPQDEHSVPYDHGVPQLHRQRDLLRAISRTINMQAQKPSVSSSKPVPLRFSGRKNRYIRAKPDPRSSHGVNPLMMHPEINTFAGPLSQGIHPSTPSHRRHRDSSEEDESVNIECAIIYCPSTGSLSEYSRKSSSPTLQNTGYQQRVRQETPTRRPLHKRSASMLKRSVSSLMTRSVSMIRLASPSPSKLSRDNSTLPSLSKQVDNPDSQVIRDRYRSTGVIRGRAVSFPNLSQSGGVRAVWDYQPTSPSPLRKDTKISDATGGRQRAVTTTTPVKISINSNYSRLNTFHDKSAI